MITKRILIIGSPGTGKTSLIQSLKKKGYYCFDEISRQVIIDAQKQGIEQLFVTEPQLFSEKLLEGRIEQFKNAESIDEEFIFYDRGIPDTVAYLDYIKSTYPKKFVTACETFQYHRVFILKLWEAIYEQDNERYETIEEARLIEQFLISTYKKYGYLLETVPFGSVRERTEFILNKI